MDRGPQGFDRAATLWFAARRTPALDRTMTDLTALGGGTVLTLVVVLVAGFLLVRGRWPSALLLALSGWSGGRVVAIVKDQVARARPDIVDHLVPVANARFPSGHAANAAIVYLTLAALAAQAVRSRGARRYLIGAAVLLVGAIGTSRVYLGVHWASDVIAGWCFGAPWALGWWRVGRWWVETTVRASPGGER